MLRDVGFNRRHAADGLADAGDVRRALDGGAVQGRLEHVLYQTGRSRGGSPGQQRRVMLNGRGQTRPGLAGSGDPEMKTKQELMRRPRRGNRRPRPTRSRPICHRRGQLYPAWRIQLPAGTPCGAGRLPPTAVPVLGVKDRGISPSWPLPCRPLACWGSRPVPSFRGRAHPPPARASADRLMPGTGRRPRISGEAHAELYPKRDPVGHSGAVSGIRLVF